MTIASALQDLANDITNARSAVVAKGGQTTVGGGSSQLATDIATIPTGITPTGTITITTNGNHDVTQYATANVNVPTGGGTTRWGGVMDDFFNTSVPANVTLSDIVIPSGQFNKFLAYVFMYSNIKTFTAYGPAIEKGTNAYQYMLSECPHLESINLYMSSSRSYAYGSYLANLAEDCPNLRHFYSNLFLPAGTQSFGSAFKNCTSLEDAVFDSFNTINYTNAFSNTFNGCSNLTKVRIGGNMSTLTIGGSSSCTNVFNYAFRNCNKLYDENINRIQMPTLTQIGYTSGTGSYGGFKYAFYSDTSSYYGKLHLIFPELASIYNRSTTSGNGHFSYSNALGKIYLPKFTADGTTGQYIFTNCPNLTEIHFGIENQATVSALGGYASKFGASSASLIFDMPNHITVSGTVYDRSGAEYDYDNSYYSWKNGSTVIYTTNAINPAVGDTIYTKSGTTYTASGTITAIA